MKYDLLITGGEVMDPSAGFRGVMDVAIAGGKIAVVAPAIPANEALRSISAKGRLVIPGLVDMHAHVLLNGHDMGMHTDTYTKASGVTTLCDAGSAGSATFGALRTVLDHHVRTRIRAFVNLSAIGIMEHSRGVCEDTFENRSILRSNQLGWDTVYATNGVPTGLIMARSKDMVTQRRLISLHEKKPILSDPNNKNSDYLTGLDLIAEPMTDKLVPTWVIGASRMWIAEQDNPIATSKRKPTALPHRCTHMKDDGIRCMLWSSGRPKDEIGRAHV